MCNIPFVIASPMQMHCSKWIRHAVLFDIDELEQWMELLSSCYFFSPVYRVSSSHWQVEKTQLWKEYNKYLDWIASQNTIPSLSLRNNFTLLISDVLDDFYAVRAGEDQYFIRARRPVLHMQLFHCFFSFLDQKFHPMAMHEDSFTFGLQLSYPQFYEDPDTGVFHKVLLEDSFSMTSMYRRLAKWLRHHTTPVVIRKGEEKMVAPFRQGKNGRDWRWANVRFAEMMNRI